MRVYVNGIDCGDGKIKRNKTYVTVLYYEAMYPTYYPTNRCIFTTRFGKRCMLYGGDYSEQGIKDINKRYAERMRSK